MEISLLKESGLRIRSKNTTLIVDPVAKVDGDVVIITPESDGKADEGLVEGKKLSVEGEGEYEVGGMSIHVADMKGERTYVVDADNMRILLLSESTLAKIKDEDEFSAVVVKVNESVKDTVLANLTSDVFIFYGDLDKVELSSENTKKLPKVNLRKKEELAGSIILLS